MKDPEGLEEGSCPLPASYLKEKKLYCIYSPKFVVFIPYIILANMPIYLIMYQNFAFFLFEILCLSLVIRRTKSEFRHPMPLFFGYLQDAEAEIMYTFQQKQKQCRDMPIEAERIYRRVKCLERIGQTVACIEKTTQERPNVMEAASAWRGRLEDI